MHQRVCGHHKTWMTFVISLMSIYSIYIVGIRTLVFPSKASIACERNPLIFWQELNKTR